MPDWDSLERQQDGLPPHLKNGFFHRRVNQKAREKNGSSFLLLPSKVFQKFYGLKKSLSRKI